MRPIIIATYDASGTHYGVSLTSHNPTDAAHIPCADKAAAEAVYAEVEAFARAVRSAALEEAAAAVDAMAAPLSSRPGGYDDYTERDQRRALEEAAEKIRALKTA